jgi:hypothetical protein
LTLQFDPNFFKGQFILTAEQHDFPGWTLNIYEGWKLFTSHLPVIDVFDMKNRRLKNAIIY